MKKISVLLAVATFMILIIPAGIAQEDDPFEPTTCVEGFCEAIKNCEDYGPGTYEECYQEWASGTWFNDCVLISKFMGGHICGTEFISCENDCFTKFPEGNPKYREAFLNCNNECDIAFDSCVAPVQVPTCTGEPEKAATKPEEEEKECKQITEDTAKYDNKFYTPNCKDNIILLTYVCKDSKSAPEEVEVDCRTVEYDIGKTYKSCSQPFLSQGSCSKDKPEITLEELTSKLKQIKDDENALYSYVIDNPEIVYMASKNREVLSDIKDANGVEIWIKLVRINDEIFRMRGGAYDYVKNGGSLREYITKNKEMEIWQFKLYSMLAEIVEKGRQAEIEDKEWKEEWKQIKKEIEIAAREKFWEEDATFVDKLGYKAMYALSFEALRVKGLSGIFGDPNRRIHEKISEAGGAFTYLPISGDVVELASLPSVLMDERMGAGWKTVHIVCAAIPFLNVATLEKIGYAVSGYSFATTEPDKYY